MVKREMSAGRAMLATGASSLVLPMAALITSPLLARALNPEGRGSMSAVLSPAMLVAGLAGLGLPAATLFHTARGGMSHRAFLRVCAAAVAAGVVAALLLTLFRPPAIDAQGGIRSVYECVAWTLPAVLLVDVLRARALGYGKYGVAVAERWTAGIVRFIAVVVCFLAGWLESVVVAVLASWLPGLVVGLVLHLASGRRSTDGAALAEADAGKIASYAARSWASSVVGLALIRATEVYMAANSTATQLGLFVIAAAVADVPILALSAVRDIVVRTLSRPEVDFAARLGLMLRVVGGLSVGSSIAIVLAAPVLVPLVFGRDYGPAVAVVQVLVVATIGNSLSSVLFAGLAARDRPQAQVVAQLFGLAAMIPGLVLSVPTFGALGAAATVAVAQLVTAFAAFVITARSMAFPMMALLVPNRGDVRAVIYVLKPGKTT